MRTARSRTSGENFLDLFMAPFSQELEPPQIPGRFKVIEAAKNEPQWRSIAKQMVHAWNEGTNGLRRPGRDAGHRGLEAAIRASGFSDPEPPQPSRVPVGRSELLAPRGKR
jgi:serine/threonine-protein kinase HipA